MARMARKSPEIEVKELGGNKYPDLTTAQNQARSALAGDLAATIRELLASGILKQINGQIIPSQNK
jgi:hypothetical protein